MINTGVQKKLLPKYTATSLPLEIDRKQMRVLPTRYGFLFIFILLAMLGGSINYNNNLGFLLTFLLGSILFISGLYTYANLAHIRIISLRLRPVFAGDKTVFRLLIRAANGRRRAICCKFRDGEAFVQDIDHGVDNRVFLSLVTEKRGIFNALPIEISSCYPSGLFMAQCVVVPDEEYVVYPKPAPGIIKPTNGFIGNTRTGKKEQMDLQDFLGLRKYQPGDALQRISWKAFSRGQGLFTKMFSGQTDDKTVLDFDGVEASDIEQKISILCFGILQADRWNRVFSLKLPGRYIASGKGDAHKHKCLKSLALLKTLHYE